MLWNPTSNNGESMTTRETNSSNIKENTGKTHKEILKLLRFSEVFTPHKTLTGFRDYYCDSIDIT